MSTNWCSLFHHTSLFISTRGGAPVEITAPRENEFGSSNQVSVSQTRKCFQHSCSP